jgi:3-hydroxyisobutyrate dehydrogenase-like beta-hydroxyacid dehydrogenase
VSERIEEIRASYNCVNTFENEAGKQEFTTKELKKVVSSQKNINNSIPYLLKELEEAQRQAADWEMTARTEYRIHNEVQNKLAEAQQTIARYKDISNDALGCMVIMSAADNEHVQRIKAGLEALGE